MIKKGVTWLKEFIVNMRAVRWDTIEEGDANAHEEGDDDEAETSAEGVNESEPVNSSLYRQHGKYDSFWSYEACRHVRLLVENKHTHISD